MAMEVMVVAVLLLLLLLLARCSVLLWWRACRRQVYRFPALALAMVTQRARLAAESG